MVKKFSRSMRRRARATYRRRGVKTIRSRAMNRIYRTKYRRTKRRFSTRTATWAKGLKQKFDFYFSPTAIGDDMANSTVMRMMANRSDSMRTFVTDTYGMVVLDNRVIDSMTASRVTPSPLITAAVTGFKVEVRTPQQYRHKPVYLCYVPSMAATYTVGTIPATVVESLGYLNRYFKARRVLQGVTQQYFIPSDTHVLAPMDSTVHVRLYVQQILRRGEIVDGFVQGNLDGARPLPQRASS